MTEPSRRLRRLCGCCLLAVSASAGAAGYPMPPAGEDLVGGTTVVMAKAGDTMATLANKHGVGFRQLVHANPRLDAWRLVPGQRVELPTSMLLPRAPRNGIVVNVPEMRLYYFPDDGANVFVYPVAVGRVDWKTPLGTTQVQAKVRDPVWHPPESIRIEHAAKGDPLPEVVPPGPDNPLGAFALRLGWPDVLIHGTNMPLGGIGMPVTHGCIRLYPQDIKTLFDQVAVGTAVAFIDEPYKIGRHNGRWHVEAHAILSENPHVRGPRDVTPTLQKLKAWEAPGIDWNKVATAIRQSDGLPTIVQAGAAAAPAAAR